MSNLSHYYMSCKKFTVLVSVDSNLKIVDAAPIVRKFKGQPVRNLWNWMKKIGGLEVVKL
jgi:hypothetical protein